MPETKQEKFVEEKVYVDFDGEGNQNKPQREKIVVPEDRYNATIKNTTTMPNPFSKEGQPQKNLVINISLEFEEKTLELPYFVSPRITKAYTTKDGKTMDNSKLYNLLSDSGLKEKAKTEQEQWSVSPDALASWLDQNLLGRKCKIFTKTNNKNTEAAYSKVDRIVSFE